MGKAMEINCFMERSTCVEFAKYNLVYHYVFCVKRNIGEETILKNDYSITIPGNNGFLLIDENY